MCSTCDCSCRQVQLRRLVGRPISSCATTSSARRPAPAGKPQSDVAADHQFLSSRLWNRVNPCMHVSVSTRVRDGRSPRRETASPTQAERRARSREALLEAAARSTSRFGYGNLVLEQVRSGGWLHARALLPAGLKDKEDLALAVIDWVDETWRQEVGNAVDRERDPVAALMALARGHAVLCRRDIARVALALQVRVQRSRPSGGPSPSRRSRKDS